MRLWSNAVPSATLGRRQSTTAASLWHPSGRALSSRAKLVGLCKQVDFSSGGWPHGLLRAGCFDQAAAPPGGRSRTCGPWAPCRGPVCDARSRRPRVQCGPGARVCNARVFKRAAGWLTLLPLSRWLARTLKAGGTGVGVLCNVFNGEGAAADGAGHAARTPTRRGATPDHQASTKIRYLLRMLR